MFQNKVASCKNIPSIFDLPLPCGVSALFETQKPIPFLQEELLNSSEKASSDASTAMSPVEFPISIETGKPVSHNDQMKGNWSPDEDNLLREAVSNLREPISWDDVAKSVTGRTAKQCRERWLFRLSPNLNKAPFQKWEDEVIVIERQRIGNRWTAIASKLPGRTSCAVKNRWYTVLRNRVNVPQIQRMAPCQNVFPQQNPGYFFMNQFPMQNMQFMKFA